MIDAPYLKAHRKASSLQRDRGLGRLIGRTKGGMNTKLHAVTDTNGRPISIIMTAGQVSDYVGAAALLDSLPGAQWLLGDRGAMMRTGSEARCRQRASHPASPVGNPRPSRSSTTNVAARA